MIWMTCYELSPVDIRRIYIGASNTVIGIFKSAPLVGTLQIETYDHQALFVPFSFGIIGCAYWDIVHYRYA
jgi:hypothetical protein